MPKYFILICVLFLLFSCKKKEAIAIINFYYWKTNFSLDTTSLKALQTNHSKTVYLRFFDIMSKDGKVYPNEIIRFNDSIPIGIDCVPVIFIKNEVFTTVKTENEIQDLAKNCSQLIAKIASTNRIKYEEIQFDCDWNLSTKKIYFSFLEEFKKLNTHSQLSATIRLHQVKYKEKTGIPPVDKYILMFYNMGDLKKISENSIFSIHTAENYTQYLSSYPKPLTFALPIFRWGIHYRGDVAFELIYDWDSDLLNQKKYYIPINDNLFEVAQSHFQNGNYFLKGDKLKLESVSSEDLISMVELIRKNYPQKKNEFIFYHLDSLLLSQYSENTFPSLAERWR